MLSFFKKFKFFAIVMLVLSVIIVTVIYQVMEPKKSLKVFQPAEVSSELVDSTLRYVKKYRTIADFSLINQNGETITEHDYKDRIYVADFFFTTCQTICPIMTDHMVQIQEALAQDNNV